MNERKLTHIGQNLWFMNVHLLAGAGVGHHRMDNFVASERVESVVVESIIERAEENKCGGEWDQV